MMNPTLVAAVITAAAVAAGLVFPLLLRWGAAEARRWQDLTRQVSSQAAPDILATPTGLAATKTPSLLDTIGGRTRRLGWTGAALLGGALGAVLALTITELHDGTAPMPMNSDSVAIMTAALLLGLIAALLIALTLIDLSTRLLPDRLTLSLLVAAFGFHVFSAQLPLAASVLGAVTGYLGLWLLATVYRWVRGPQPIGRGDFAMLAGIGAWVGWQQLPLVLLAASISGLVAAGVLHLLRPRSALLTQQIAFGPPLAVGAVLGWVSLG
jgi:prepilin signal peptidase PulO-like enzyme (type II secretory pathway)